MTFKLTILPLLQAGAAGRLNVLSKLNGSTLKFFRNLFSGVRLSLVGGLFSGTEKKEKKRKNPSLFHSVAYFCGVGVMVTF